MVEVVWDNTKTKATGIILAYDEAQNLKDPKDAKEFPLSVLLEITQYIQRKQIPYLLILTGLPTLFPNLVKARTYSERMFHVMTLDRLSNQESSEAITKPIQDEQCPVTITEWAIMEIINYSGGYPYFIQYICKEMFDSYLQQKAMGTEVPVVMLEEVTRKLDSDFYQGRWDGITDRQKELLAIISKFPHAEEEFTIKEIVEESNKTGAAFKTSPLNLMLKSLTDSGLIYKNKHGKYSFAVPMFSHFIKRQTKDEGVSLFDYNIDDIQPS